MAKLIWGSRFICRLRAVHRDEKGQVLVIAALALPVLLGVGALAVDVGYVYVARTAIQNAADSGARAGAAGLANGGQTQATLDATNFADLNIAQSNFLSGATSTVSFPDADSVQVTINHPTLPLFFARVIGFNTTVVNAAATATLENVNSVPPNTVVPLAICCNKPDGCKGSLSVGQRLSLRRNSGDSFQDDTGGHSNKDDTGGYSNKDDTGGHSNKDDAAGNSKKGGYSNKDDTGGHSNKDDVAGNSKQGGHSNKDDVAGNSKQGGHSNKDDTAGNSKQRGHSNKDDTAGNSSSSSQDVAGGISSSGNASENTVADGEIFLQGIHFDENESNDVFRTAVRDGYDGTVTLGQSAGVHPDVLNDSRFGMTDRLADGRNEMILPVCRGQNPQSSNSNISVADFVQVRVSSFDANTDTTNLEIIRTTVSTTDFAPTGQGLNINSVSGVRLTQ